MKPIRTVRQFVECFLRSRSRLESCGSSLGWQLDALRNSIDGSLFIRDDGDASRAALNPMSRLADHGWLAVVWGVLDAEEQRVLELSHTNKGVAFISVERSVAQMDGADGAELVRLIYDEDGELTDRGIYLVTEPQRHTAEDIAEIMGLSERQVRRRITTAGEKIRARLEISKETARN